MAGPQSLPPLVHPAQLPEFATELDFFTQTVGLAEKYNPVPMLKDAGIKPGSATVTKTAFTA